MNRYIWLNPVVTQMYSPAVLEEMLHQLGYQQVFCKQDHITAVRNHYRQEIAGSSLCIADMRCPKAVEYIQKTFPHAKIRYPEIEPILLHCARELAKTYGQTANAALTIITPCKELRDMGNEKKLPNTIFMTWLDFLSQYNKKPSKQQLDASPIPPGFFSEYGSGHVSLYSREQLDQFYEKNRFQELKIVEMLYCDNGCHNGNGV